MDFDAYRLGAFLAIVLLLALWEFAAPRRKPRFMRAERWPHNFLLLGIDVLVLRLLAPGAALATAAAADANGWGVLRGYPEWLAVVSAVLLLDLVVYFQHVTFHAVPALWRLHRVHHSDLDFDLTTGIRFHPIEIAISTVVKCVAIAALGAPVLAVFAFELLLNATAMFSHANVRMPGALDRALRWLVVTPDMHRVHHSLRYNESSSNFGFNAPWWDRLFGTYREEPAAGHEGMTVGVDAFRSKADLRIDRLLTQPWHESPGGYSINRRPEPHS